MSGNIFSDAAIEQIRRVVREEQGRVRGNRAEPMPPIAQGPEMFIGHFPNGCTAMAGTTPGNGAAELYKKNSDGVLEALLLSDAETANSREVYNPSGTALGSGAYSPVWRDKLGTWWVSPWGSSSSRPTVWQMFSWSLTDSAGGSPRTIRTYTMASSGTTLAHPQLLVAGPPYYVYATETFYFPYIAIGQIGATSLTTTSYYTFCGMNYNPSTTNYTQNHSFKSSGVIYTTDLYNASYTPSPNTTVSCGVGQAVGGQRLAAELYWIGDTSAAVDATFYWLIGPKLYAT